MEPPLTVGRRPTVRLTEREREILAFERQWWKYAGAKEQAIKDLFDMSATRYYQVLNALHRPSRGPGRRPDAGQAAAPAAHHPPADPLRAAPRHGRLAPVTGPRTRGTPTGTSRRSIRATLTRRRSQLPEPEPEPIYDTGSDAWWRQQAAAQRAAARAGPAPPVAAPAGCPLVPPPELVEPRCSTPRAAGPSPAPPELADLPRRGGLAGGRGAPRSRSRSRSRAGRRGDPRGRGGLGRLPARRRGRLGRRHHGLRRAGGGYEPGRAGGDRAGRARAALGLVPRAGGHRSATAVAADMPERDCPPLPWSRCRSASRTPVKRVSPGRAVPVPGVALLGVLLAIGSLIFFTATTSPRAARPSPCRRSRPRPRPPTPTAHGEPTAEPTPSRRPGRRRRRPRRRRRRSCR